MERDKKMKKIMASEVKNDKKINENILLYIKKRSYNIFKNIL